MAAITEAELSLRTECLAPQGKTPRFDIKISKIRNDDNEIPKNSTESIHQIPVASVDIQLECRVSVIPKLQHFCRGFEIFAVHNNQEVGQARTCYIDRKCLKALQPRNFHGSLEQLHSQSDGHAFALDLCTRDGSLQSKHLVHPWGNELNYGAVLILKLLIVEKEYRRQSIARGLLRAQIAKAKKQKSGLRFVFVKPGVVPDDVEKQINDDMPEEEILEVQKLAYTNAVRFYRAFGFRKVGLSNWFCFAMDPEHSSHRIAPEEEFDVTPRPR